MGWVTKKQKNGPYFWAAVQMHWEGSIHPQHLKLLPGGRDLYRHLITLAFAQHGPAQRGFAADDLNGQSAAENDALLASSMQPVRMRQWD
jgi:hypothetical protein